MGSTDWRAFDGGYAYLTVATTTCTLYDHLTTFDEEIEFVWKRPKWRVVQMLFFLNRYAGLALQICQSFVQVRHNVKNTFEGCNLFNVLNGYLVMISVCSMQGIMICRISSMYLHNRKIIALLGGSCVLEVGFLILIQCLAGSVTAPVPDPAPGLRLCTQNSIPSWMYTTLIPVVCFELLILILAILLAIKYYRSIKIIQNSESPSVCLAYILLRDSITFPFIGVTLCLINLGTWIRLPYLDGQMAYTLASFAPCIIGSRLILNLREAYYQPFTEECNINNEDLCMIDGTGTST